MKKMLLLLALIIAILLSACGNSGVNDSGMTIRPSKFSEETQGVLKIFEDEMVFLDYTVDETVKYFSVNIWWYKNGEWVADGKLSDSIDYLSNRIGIRLKESGIEVFSLEENGDYTKYGFFQDETVFFDSNVATTHISNPTPISLNEEIPLWIKFGMDKSGKLIRISDDFKKLDCNGGVAVTVTFSDKEVE
ncbi:MAG: hypothetical protein PHU31_10890 [Anaerotignum sp.]|nr:hypothetical protein [Anaerotignum sp.]